MSLQTRLDSLISAIGADIKSLRTAVSSWAATLTNATTATETVVAQFTLAANDLVAGSQLNLRSLGQVSGNATLTYKVRMGTAGTTADPVLVTFATSAAGVANAHTSTNIHIVCLTAGTSGTVTAGGQAMLASAILGPVTAAFAAATVNTTVAQKVSLTATLSAAQTLTSRAAVLRRFI